MTSRAGPAASTASDLPLGGHAANSHYNGSAVEVARTVRPSGADANSRSGFDKEFS
jgi:hypothetical protein